VERGGPAVAFGFGRDGNEGSVLMTEGLWLSLVLAKEKGGFNR